MKLQQIIKRLTRAGVDVCSTLEFCHDRGFWLGDPDGADGALQHTLPEWHARAIYLGYLKDWLYCRAETDEQLEELTVCDELNIERRRAINNHKRNRVCVILDTETGTIRHTEPTELEALALCVLDYLEQTNE